MDDLLQQGIVAFKAGKRDEARKLFISAVKQNQDNERAWGGMYEVSGDNKERIYCLKQMLRINPENEKAKQILNQLLAPSFTSNSSSQRKSNTGLIAIVSTFLFVIFCAGIIIISALSSGDLLSIITPPKSNTALPISTIVALTYSAACTQTAMVSGPVPLSTSTLAPPTESIPTATLYIYSTNTPFIFVQPTLIVIPTPLGGSGGSCCKHCGSKKAF
jgi:hypothetical protein